MLILLNAAIGASSAPFYDKYTVCTRYELTDHCRVLMKYTSVLYGFEVVGSLILVVHGLLGMVLKEYVKRIKVIKTLNYYTKVAIILYAIDVLLRTAIYFKIVSLIEPVEEDGHEVDFGSFLAVYCDGSVDGIIITAILMAIYTVCFMSTCLLWKITNDLENTVK